MTMFVCKRHKDPENKITRCLADILPLGEKAYRTSTADSPWDNTTKNWLISFDTNHWTTRITLTCVDTTFSISCAQHSVFVDIISCVGCITDGIVDNWNLKWKLLTRNFVMKLLFEGHKDLGFIIWTILIKSVWFSVMNVLITGYKWAVMDW